jgi:hypothetical protein
MTTEQPTWERLLDLAVYAPVGVAIAVRDDLPRYAQQGRQALENRVMLARFIGQFAVKQGQRELAKLIEARRQTTDRPTTEEPVHVHVVRESARPQEAATVTGAAVEAPEADQLPIAEYESLAASQVVQRLGSLLPEELEAIRAFEVAHRARRTVLGKIAQLQGD